MDTLLLQSGISSYNFFWFFLIVPFALLTIIRFYEFTGILCYLCGIWLLMAMNSYWYLICKTLLNEKLLYILLPIGVYGLLAGTEFIPEGNPVSTFMMNLGEGFYRRKHTRLSRCHSSHIVASASKSQATATLHL